MCFNLVCFELFVLWNIFLIIFKKDLVPLVASQVALAVKNSGYARVEGSVLGSGGFSGVGTGNPLHILAWKIPRTEDPDHSTVHGITKSHISISCIIASNMLAECVGEGPLHKGCQ